MSDTSIPTDTTPAAAEVEPETETAQPTAEVKIDPIPAFDSLDEAPSKKPRFFVAGSTFIAQTENGELQVLLRFPTKKVREMPDDLGSNLEIMYYLYGDDSALGHALDELDISESHDIANAMVQAHNEKQRARLGK